MSRYDLTEFEWRTIEPLLVQAEALSPRRHALRRAGR